MLAALYDALLWFFSLSSEENPPTDAERDKGRPTPVEDYEDGLG